MDEKEAKYAWGYEDLNEDEYKNMDFPILAWLRKRLYNYFTSNDFKDRYIKVLEEMRNCEYDSDNMEKLQTQIDDWENKDLEEWYMEETE